MDPLSSPPARIALKLFWGFLLLVALLVFSAVQYEFVYRAF